MKLTPTIQKYKTVMNLYRKYVVQHEIVDYKHMPRIKDTDHWKNFIIVELSGIDNFIVEGRFLDQINYTGPWKTIF